MDRPFIRSSIEELEAAFSARRGERDFLLVLSEELRNRTFKRARRLRNSVERELSAPAQNGQSKPSEGAGCEAQPKTGAVKLAEPDVAPAASPMRSNAQHPPVSNDPGEIISTWIALEVLSPPAFGRPEQLAAGNRSAVAPLGEGALPWERGEKSRPNCRLYYQIVLGTVRMEKAISRLIERFGDSRPDFPGSKGNAILATVIVDREGRLVESPAVSVSSFGWGVMAALTGWLSDLAGWPEAEPGIVRRVEKELLSFGSGEDDEEKRKTPLTRRAIISAYEALLRETGLPSELAEAPSFAIRSYGHYRNPNPPEPLLLNSFFLADLGLARTLLRQRKAPENLLRYLGAQPARNRVDLLRDRAALEAAIAPRMTGLSKWPAPGRHSLTLLQQAAVNLAFSETRNGGMIGVNGPPGTGKTTLLRDILAGVVTGRAEAMMRFDDPESAFTHSAQKVRAGNAWLHLYRVDPSLRGFEMVVASSNNRAVENVSREIPAVSSIASDEADMRYFKALSDEIHGRETWGLIAAVLGNSANRRSFKDAFWWNGDLSMNAYLSAAAGSVPQVSKTNAVTGEVEFTVPRIVAEEKPPKSHEDALDRWNGARKRFRSAFEESLKWQAWLESVRQDMLSLDALIAAEESAKEARELSVSTLREAEAASEGAGERLRIAQAQLAREEARCASHRASRPGFWSRLWATAKARRWAREDRSLRAELERARDFVAEGSKQRRQAEELRDSASAECQRAESAHGAAHAARVEAEARLREAAEDYGVILPDEKFFGQEYSARQRASVWFPEEAQRARDDLFAEGIRLHRAFIDAAAKPLRNNLGALMNVLSGNSLPGREKEALLPDLWSTLFLVVPVVSTTFASVGRMLGKLPPKALGWLLIDEAGQALPQAAVGAIIRSERVVVVGDPAQIEPVVALPDALTEAIARSFGVDPDANSAPAASVQTLADAASSFSTEFQTKAGTRSVGVPLLVHRRCAEPMFSVSNAIAYSGLMVQAKTPTKSAIREALGPSKWIHVEGTGEDKWCGEEGAEVVRLLRSLAEARVIPDLYIVTPFVIVAERLRGLIRETGVLRDLIEEDEVWKWVAERVGTVHTVQGREAEAVILVLGAPNASQTGARGWAGGRPNLLNVAVTRAKEVLYVIGNRTLWRGAGHFGELDARLE